MDSVVADFVKADGVVTIGATVPTGLEFSAHDEIKEKIDVVASETGQGKVYFQTTVNCLSDLHKLRSVDRLFLVVKTFKDYVYDEDREKAIKDIQALAPLLPYEEMIKFWKENLKHQKIVSHKRKSYVSEEDEKNSNANIDRHGSSSMLKDNDISIARFRASANRVGKNQSITSPDAEYHLGGAIQDSTQWTVDLSNYNLEILITLGTDFVMIALSLTKESLHRRNITNFTYTTLRASIAYNMLRMCNVQDGELVIDPMCGSGAIPIEGSQEWKNAVYMAGDNSELAVLKCRANIASLNIARETANVVETLRWDVKNLPLKSGSADVFITDLPFGKRVGSKMDNRTLYPSMLTELARVSKLKSARACILTNDKRSILKAIAFVSSLWILKRTASVNIGGLRAAVYLLQRTAKAALNSQP